MFTYLLLNLFSVSIPLIFSFHKRLNFYRTWYALWPAILVSGTVFIIWDIYFTRWCVWGFNPDYLIGINWLHLPLEEWLFFICIPYACVFTYACLKILIPKDYLGRFARMITGLLAGALLLIALPHLDQLYTSVTFIACSVFLILHLLVFKSSYLGRFYVAYMVLFCLPFPIVNGFLTGSFTNEPIVWYNNEENLSLRVFTIPVEDFIYGLLLMLMNVSVYEGLISRKRSSGDC